MLCSGAAEGVQDWSDHLKMNLYLTIIGPTITLKIQGFDHSDKIFGPTKVGVVGPAPPALMFIYMRSKLRGL